MEDKLKQFVNKHRDEFDTFEPRQELWQQICQEMPATPQKEHKKESKGISINFGDYFSVQADFMFMRVAAAIVLLLTCGTTLYLVKQQPLPTVTGETLAVREETRMHNVAPDLLEVEAYYTNQIEQKRNELSSYDLKVLGLDEQQEIDREMARLDSSYTQLKTKLLTIPNTEPVMSAMIQNLQIRIEVLNRQLEVLQKIEAIKNKATTEQTENETTTNA